jgi:hypothetical protein
MIENQTRTAILAIFSNVPTEELEELANGVFRTFTRIVESEGIDMDRMKTVIQLTKLRVIYHCLKRVISAVLVINVLFIYRF